jgi:hypothetical protein
MLDEAIAATPSIPTPSDYSGGGFGGGGFGGGGFGGGGFGGGGFVGGGFGGGGFSGDAPSVSVGGVFGSNAAPRVDVHTTAATMQQQLSQQPPLMNVNVRPMIPPLEPSSAPSGSGLRSEPQPPRALAPDQALAFEGLGIGEMMLAAKRGGEQARPNGGPKAKQ